MISLIWVSSAYCFSIEPALMVGNRSNVRSVSKDFVMLFLSSCNYTTHWLLWDLGGLYLYHSSVSKAFTIYFLGSVTFKFHLAERPEILLVHTQHWGSLSLSPSQNSPQLSGSQGPFSVLEARELDFLCGFF